MHMNSADRSCPVLFTDVPLLKTSLNKINKILYGIMSMLTIDLESSDFIALLSPLDLRWKQRDTGN